MVLLKMPDSGDIHGGLLALSELAAAFRQSSDHDLLEPDRRKVWALRYQPYALLANNVRNVLRFSLLSRRFL